MAAYDITLLIDDVDNPFELAFLSGDFIVDKVDEQNIRLALLSGKGNWKQYPLVGAEIAKLLHASARSNYKQIVTQELERIGYRVTKFEGGTADFNSQMDFLLEVEEL